MIPFNSVSAMCQELCIIMYGEKERDRERKEKRKKEQNCQKQLDEEIGLQKLDILREKIQTRRRSEGGIFPNMFAVK